ncbi:hypothetical protein D9756_006658 [Leucocoprinus leucothites]|uniref:GDP/GTP exchange factor Sec2 N-terminal domain-containing protein n=1 Tax=Leucocoprinus leucothites TaxID=201217 RepID=A0A8H5G2C8_9AGAR|nr:hypothetical protein D9756_006658 [Leucoagaricus leucothites]
MAEDILDSNPDSNPQNPKENPAGNEVLNGTNGNHKHYAADPEAQEMVIESLRNQIQDLFSQVTQLNGKLVKSYDRVSDLEDELHVSSAQLRTSSVKVSQLELERTQHLAALNTGLLVEKDHVTTELNRLMEKATEEAAQRGQAESARAAIEQELDDLSASLFNQANTMVAEARYAQHISQRKAEDAEQALRGAEEAVSAMQQQVQALQEEKESAERKATEIQTVMGKGKWIDRRDSQPVAPTLRLFSFHLPYQEFLSFIAHLRHLHLNSTSPPAMSTLLPLPFLTRLSTEDSDPTVRLDLAPSLSWLSRRSVLSAIHNGQLTIEPMAFTTLLMESSHLSNAGISGSANNEYIPCALCGTPVFSQAPSTNTSPTRPPTHPLKGMAHSYSGSGSSWSTSLFKKSPSSSNSITSGPPSIPPRSSARTTQVASNVVYPSQVYIFRISSNQTSSLPQLPLLKSSSSAAQSGSSTLSSSSQNMSSLPHSSVGSGAPSQSSTTIYPLCTNGWCLARLRTTCSMWAFVRTGIVERVWEEELPVVLPPPVPNRTVTSTPVSINSSNPANGPGATEKPPIPPRKRGLWGLASAIGERAASWSESTGEKAKRLAATPAPASEKENKTLPPTPPHPRERPDISETTAPPLPATSAAPPPLPKRSEGRARTPVNPPPSTSPSASPSNNAGTSTTDAPIASNATQLPPAEVKSSSPTPEAVVNKDQPDHSPVLPTESASGTVAALSTPPQTPTRPHGPPIPPRAVKRLSASLARPGTPSSVPLPDSRPSTPPVTTNPPSRTSSPALGSSPAASGAPPPIPRRAAARAPRKPIGESGDNSRPSSPAVPASPAKGGDVQAQEQATASPQPQLDSVKEIVEESKEGRKESEESTVLEGPEPPKAIEHASSLQSNVSAVSETDVFVDAEDGTQGEEDEKEKSSVKTVKGDKETKEALAETGGDIAKETKQEDAVMATPEQKEGPVISLNDQDLPPPVTSDATDAPPALPPRRSEAEKEVVKGDEMNDVDGSKAGGSDDGEDDGSMYISGRTWEERTWRELSRLREEMFLARTGAVRS